MIQLLLLVALLPLPLLEHHHRVLAAGLSLNDSLAVDTRQSEIMQVVRQHRPKRFSYCLRRKARVPGQRHGFLRMDGEVPSTSGMAHTQLLYNANHAADYGPYYVELVGVSVKGKRLEGIDAATFRRDAATGSGGTVFDVGEPVLTMPQAAYEILERAVEKELRSVGLPRVSHPGYLFCLRGATGDFFRKHIPEVVLHFREPGADLRIPPSNLFSLIDQDTCMVVFPGHMTVIGTVPQLETRFTFDLTSGTVFFSPANCELDNGT